MMVLLHLVGSGANTGRRMDEVSTSLQTVTAKVRSNQMGFQPSKGVKFFQTASTLCSVEEMSDRMHLSVNSKHMRTASTLGGKPLLTCHASEDPCFTGLDICRGPIA